MTPKQQKEPYTSAQQYPGLYFPIAGECGLKSALTPELGGDAKLDQNHFLLEPASMGNLNAENGSRNFWCVPEDGRLWSVTGHSPMQEALRFTEEEEEVTVSAGYMWHTVTRQGTAVPLKASVTSFIPYQKNMEIHKIEIPIYGRSADNIRDHRHVTSLLHRVKVTEGGVQVCPAFSFDERGHQLKYPGIKLMFSEGCVEYSRFADGGEVRKAEMYAHDMMGNFRAGVSSFLDWNLLLDEQGGPNHVGNFCAAPIMLDSEGGFVKQLSYYYIGQFSRYIPAGSVRIATTQYTDGLEVCAFLTPSGERVLVTLNKTGEGKPVVIREGDEGFTDEIINKIFRLKEDVFMKLRKLISLVLVGAMTLTLGACGNSNTAADSTGGSAAESTAAGSTQAADI